MSIVPSLTKTGNSGDMFEWDAFWDQFKNTIHDMKDINLVEKIGYLKGQLVDTAKK